MIKRIKGSLFAKVFILTVAVLLCVSFLVYGVLAWYMPQTYSNNLNAALDEQTSDFIYELEHIRMQDSGGLFDQFLQNTTISMVELYTADGVLVETPSNDTEHDTITLRRSVRVLFRAATFAFYLLRLHSRHLSKIFWNFT